MRAESRSSLRYRALLQLLRTSDTVWNASGAFFSRWELGPSQFNVLNLLYGRKGLSQTELSRELIMHRSNVTGLVDRLEVRALVQRRPVVYQMVAGERREVRAGYVLLDRDSGGRAHEVAFAASDYDHRVALVLDPTLVFAQLLGGSSDDKGASVATDAAGNIYLAGYTNSANFPTTAGAYQTATPAGYDAFVRKLGADGSTVVYSTLLGGNNGNDYLQSIAPTGYAAFYRLQIKEEPESVVPIAIAITAISTKT